MAEIEEHRNKYLTNLYFLDTIKDTDFYDWEITVLFYATLHMMHAALLMKNVNVEDFCDSRRRFRITHGIIKRAIETTFGEEILDTYSSLLQLSYQARYVAENIIEKDDYNEAFEYFEKLQVFCTVVLNEWSCPEVETEAETVPVSSPTTYFSSTSIHH